MTKYNHYARELSDAFTRARQEYTDAWNKLQTAKKNRDAALEWHQEKQMGENERNRKLAEAMYLLEEEAFKEAEAIWPKFNRYREELSAKLESELQKDRVMVPDAIDTAALELLRSGLMGMDDYSDMAGRFDANPTMLKFVSKYAREAADGMDNSRSAERGALYKLAQDCQSGESAVLRGWASLSQVADYCSGQARNQKETPDFIVSMGKRWEELTENHISEF